MLPKRFNALRELSHTVPPEQAKGLLRSARRAETGFAGGAKPALPAGRNRLCRRAETGFAGRPGSDDALGHHRVGDLVEAGDVRARDEVVFPPVLLCGGGDMVVDADHDFFELRVHFVEGPGQAH